MSDTILDVSDIVNVTIQAAPSGLGLPNINTLALFTKETPSWGDEYRVYVSASDVATDFGSGSNAYRIATAVFSQQPSPLNTGGYLAIIPRTSGGTEFVETAIARMKSKIYFFGILIDELLADNKLADLATAVQALDKMLFYAASDHTKFAPGGALDLIRTGTKTHTRALSYTGGTAIETQALAAAYASRLLSTDFGGSRTAQTMNLKALATLVPDATIDETAYLAAGTAGVDVYANMGGAPSVLCSGGNQFSDDVYNQFWLKFALQVAGFNYLRQTNSKIPQTEEGMEGLKNEYRKVLRQGVVNGYLAPGSWTSPDKFGDPESLVRSVTDIGYYVYSGPVASQLQVDRAARKAPLVQIAAKAAGAIHRSNVLVNINQ